MKRIQISILAIPFIVCLISIFSTISSQSVRYDGYRVLRFLAYTDNQMVALVKFYAEHKPIVWDAVKSYEDGGAGPALVLAPHQEQFTEALEDTGLKIIEMHSDMQKLFDLQQAVNKSDGKLDWKSYNTLDDIYQHLLNLKNASVSNTSNFVIDVGSIGKTTEDREILYIKLGKIASARDPKPKPSILIDSNIHGREWISSAVTTFLINEIIYSSDPEISSWTDYFDFYVIPVLNPDGFEYSHTTDRYWRKNRSKYFNPFNSTTFLPCRGTDLNRNFDFHWNEFGASEDPCSEIYAGSSALSEPEIIAFAKFVNKTFGNETNRYLAAYFTLHSFGQLILLPFGTLENNTHFDEQMRVATAASEAHSRRYGTKFKVGNIAELLYGAQLSGTSADWVKSVHKVPMSFTYELRDTGDLGFFLPPEDIIPSALEFIDGFKVHMQHLINPTKENNLVDVDTAQPDYDEF